MTYSSKKLLITLMAFLILVFFGFGIASASLDQPSVGQTVPTRTPVPQPTKDEPPKEEPPKEETGGGGNPQPADTPVPPTQTPVPVTLAPTPIDGFIAPTRCGDPFFVANLGSVNVRLEPTTESEIIAKLVYLEARQVIGRSAEEPWWQVLLPDTSIGWVYDTAGEMVGVLEFVPVINADGTPANEIAWQPTPDLFCPTLTPTTEPTETETPIPTETPQPSPTASEQSIASIDDSEGTNEKPAGGGGTEETSVPVEITIDPQVISSLPEEEDQLSALVSAEQADLDSERELSQKPESPSAVVSGSQTATNGSGGFSWPIVAGLILIVFGIGALIFQRRQESEN